MIGWTSDGAELICTRREGWANSLTGIYLWRPETPSASRAIVTSDALIECQPSGNGLLCLREGSSAPRHFVKFDLRKKEAEKLFDPNPEFDHLLLGRVERLNWRNGFGVPWYGDLVYHCLLYTSDAADEPSRVELGGGRIIKKKKNMGQPVA